MVDIRVNSKEGYDTGVNNNLFIILNTTLTEDLINEGIARELISKVQQLRKNKNFNITDLDLDNYSDEVKKVVDEVTNLNGIDVYLDVFKV